jgi:DNA-binding SARP family transcriptional activator
MPFRFRILGPLEVDRNGRQLPLGGAKQRGLLALLLLRANEVVSTDRLIDELWNESATPGAAKALQVYVSRLRRTLGEGATNGSNGILATRDRGYVLQVDGRQLDLSEFRRLVEEGRSELAAGDARRAARTLAGALKLWRGRALEDLAHETYLQGEIRKLEELRVEALEERFDADLALGRHAEVVSELEALAEQHPYRERLQAQLMIALNRCHRQAEALEV